MKTTSDSLPLITDAVILDFVESETKEMIGTAQIPTRVWQCFEKKAAKLNLSVEEMFAVSARSTLVATEGITMPENVFLFAQKLHKYRTALGAIFGPKVNLDIDRRDLNFVVAMRSELGIGAWISIAKVLPSRAGKLKGITVQSQGKPINCFLVNVKIEPPNFYVQWARSAPGYPARDTVGARWATFVNSVNSNHF